MTSWVKPVRELNAQEQSQVEAWRRCNKTPLEICQLLDWNPEAYLGVVRRQCESLPRRYRVGIVERLSAGSRVDRSTTRPKQVTA
jgi:hypothetical protein